MFNAPTPLRLVIGIAIIAVSLAVYNLRPGADAPEPPAEAAVTDAALPRLVDLGADKCIPCKKMAPILEELKVTYEAEMVVEFIDVWKDPEAAKPYGIRVIPTQIFFAADGTELFRHEGFFGREEILAKWRELGVTLPEKEA